MTEEPRDLIETDDPSKVVQINAFRPKNHGVRKTKATSQPTAPKMESIIKKVMTEETERRYKEVTPEEEEFIDLFLSGISLSEAYKLALPERAVKLTRKGEPALDANGKTTEASTEHIWERANKLIGTLRIKAALRRKLEQKMNDVAHTSLVVRNFVLERYLYEAVHAKSDSARIQALDRLRTYGEVAERDREQTEKLKSPNEVLADIERHLVELNA